MMMQHEWCLLLLLVVLVLPSIHKDHVHRLLLLLLRSLLLLWRRWIRCILLRLWLLLLWHAHVVGHQRVLLLLRCRSELVGGLVVVVVVRLRLVRR